MLSLEALTGPTAVEQSIGPTLSELYRHRVQGARYRVQVQGAGTFQHWDAYSAEATCLANTRESATQPGPARPEPLRTVGGEKVPGTHLRNWPGKTVWALPSSGKGKPIHGIDSAQGPACTWWVMWKDGGVQGVPRGDLILGENNPCSELYGGRVTSGCISPLLRLPHIKAIPAGTSRCWPGWRQEEKFIAVFNLMV